MGDLQAALLTIGTVLVFLGISEGLATLDRVSKETARKMIHISVGNVIFFVPLFETRLLAAGIPFLFVFGNYLLSPMSPIEKMRLKTFKAGHAWGTILYPLSLSICTYLFFDNPWILVAVFLPVVYGDGFAAVFGPKAKSGLFRIYGSTKSLLGTSVVGLFSCGTVSIGVIILGYPIGLALTAGAIVGMISPFIELGSPKGTDNFVLPLTLSLIIGLSADRIVELSGQIDGTMYLIGLGGGLLFGVGGYISNVLTADGAITGFFITTLMLGVGGYVPGLELLLFFVLGSGATKLVTRIAGSTQAEFEKGSERRDAIQAVAKAGVPAILSFCYVIFDNEIFLLGLTGMMAAALIDTMATEVGIAFQGTPVKVLQPWKKAEPGDTGVLSAKGTLGGMGFGILFAIAVYYTGKLVGAWDDYLLLPFVILVVIAGTLGMVTDSILGTTLQRKNICQVCNKILEASTHHEKETDHHSGISWFNNDVTNILATVSGGIWIVLFFAFL